MKITAPAKLNLFLHITGRRDDGYHLLESLFVFTEFGDIVDIKSDKTLSLVIDGPFAETLKNESIENNIAYRAALLLQKKYRVLDGAKIHLIKNIPIGAGLGGGSSDAAAVLKGLNQLWNLNLNLETLCEIGLLLGADIPACIIAKPAIISGIGETITPFELPFSIPVLLVNPNLPLATSAVFQAYKNNHQPFTVCLNQKINTANYTVLIDSLAAAHNDLQTSALQLLSEIQTILILLRQQSGCDLARMSGSGATCFALFSDFSAAESAMKIITKNHPTFWIQLSSIQCST
ncbi:MAG: 4-(cytidine 5'-diphospho)-2-C-methyl-D-erythritol kinase [Gammaproteobacteria bacterium RIFCSPHIGHO2_12_FULL_36_30]|nr:MAG: 4-(cytidine 5'-diphospho)-2-C-methyl-D-erythritol kinase [Gammaproteobacteria bacterium RIFCSPHIGHO2_12_FULL_36_30]